MGYEKTYSIGEASTICHIPIKTLRYYDEIDLMRPSYKNPETGYRYYQLDQLIQLHFIKQLKALNFSLKEIRDAISAGNIRDETKKLVQKKLDQVEEEKMALRAIQVSGHLFLDRLEHGDFIQQNQVVDGYSEGTIQLEQIPAQDLFAIRRPLENYRNEIPNVDRWGEVIELVRAHNAIMAGPLSTIYHHLPMEQFYISTCDYEVVVPIKNGDLKKCKYFRREESFSAVTTFHVGNYSGLIEPYLNLMKWIHENNFVVSGPMRDVFIISPIDTTNRDDCITKIVIPVRKQEA